MIIMKNGEFEFGDSEHREYDINEPYYDIDAHEMVIQHAGDEE